MLYQWDVWHAMTHSLGVCMNFGSCGNKEKRSKFNKKLK